MNDKIITIKKLTKYYGKTKGIEDLSLELNEGEIFGIIGSNGAGKTTTIRSIMNMLNKDNGSVFIKGKEFTKKNYKLKEIIGYLPSEINLYGEMTVNDIFKYHESFYKKDLTKRKNQLVKRFKIDTKKRIEDLSLGNLKKIGIVLAFMHEPKLLILDEATSGLDPLMQEEFYELLKEEKERGTTIIYSTHVLNEVKKICDRIGIFKNGNLIKIEKVKKIFEDNNTIVTIKSKNLDDIVKALHIETIYEEQNIIKFKNVFSYNELLNKLSSFDIEKILIEDMDLEDLFMYYYK